jgi:hypothetical protein
VETEFDSIGVDTPEDLERVRTALAERGGGFAGEPADARAGVARG